MALANAARASSGSRRPRPGRSRRSRSPRRPSLRALGVGAQPARPADRRRLRALRRGVAQRRLHRGLARAGRRPARPLARRRRARRARCSPRILALADERGEAMSYAWLRLNLCELELKAGEWDARRAAARRVGRVRRPARCSSRRRTGAAARCSRPGAGWPTRPRSGRAPALEEAQALRLRLAGARVAARARDRRAARRTTRRERPSTCGAVWEHTAREGIDEPGAFPVAPDLVEALAELGELAEAQAVTDRLRDLAERQEHPWGLATAQRCARRGPARAAATTRRRPRRSRRRPPRTRRSACGPTPRARGSRLGRAQRRHRRWGGARASLEAAAAAFDALGSPGWAERARAELARVGARRPAAERRADAGRAPRRRAGRRGPREQGDRAGRCSSRSAPSRRTSRTPTPSSACARGRAHRARRSPQHRGHRPSGRGRRASR